MTNNIHLYRPCVGIALFNDKGQVFVGERIDTPGAWQMPQGGIDEGENTHVAAFREMLEEIGTDNAHILEEMDEKVYYDIPPEVLERLHKIWDKPYVGQEQTWVAMRFAGQNGDIDLEAHDSPEFSQWKWVDLDEIFDLIVPFKQDVYKQVTEAFRKFSKPA